MRSRLLHLIMGSASFKTYLQVLARTTIYRRPILPRRDHIHKYLQYKRANLCSKNTQNNVGDEEDAKEEESIQDEEVEGDDEYDFYLEGISSMVGDAINLWSIYFLTYPIVLCNRKDDQNVSFQVYEDFHRSIARNADVGVVLLPCTH